MMRRLEVALTFDAESDYFDPHVAPDSANELAFRGVRDGIPAIVNLLAEFEHTEGIRIPCTWFVRCDDQFASVLGNTGYLLDEYAGTWSELHLRGDEIGLHCHLYCRQDGVWILDLEPSRQKEQVRRVLDCFHERNWNPRCSRIGEAYSSNEILETLDHAGIRCDSTAMPGRARNDEHRRFDWAVTPPRPYFPSRKDYRIPGHPQLRLLEIPMSMAPIRAPYDAAPQLRYIDPSFAHEALRPGLESLLPDAEYLLTVMHPSTILKDAEDRPHGLLSFDLETMRTNLAFLFSQALKAGRTLEFVTLSGLADSLSSQRT